MESEDEVLMQDEAMAQELERDGTQTKWKLLSKRLQEPRRFYLRHLTPARTHWQRGRLHGQRHLLTHVPSETLHPQFVPAIFQFRFFQ